MKFEFINESFLIDSMESKKISRLGNLGHLVPPGALECSKFLSLGKYFETIKLVRTS